LQTLVRSFAIARKNLAAYPPGHPAVVGSVAAAHRRLEELVEAGGKLTLGVTRDALLFGDETLSFVHARDLAQTLYRRAVAAVRIEPGVEAAELESFLRLLGPEAAGKDGPPLTQELAAAGIRHIHIEGVDYSTVTATDELDASSKAGPRSLWEDVLRAMLSGEGLSAESRKMVESGGARSAPGIAALLREASEGADGARRATLAALVAQAVGRHLAAAPAAERLLAVKQVAELVRAIPPEMKETLLAAALKALASEESAAEALQALASLSAPDVVLRALRGMKDQMPLSSHALRLLQTLSAHAAPADSAAGDQAQQAALLAEMTQFFRNDDIDRYNPDDHKALLENVSLGLPPGTGEDVAADPGDRVESLGDEATTEVLALTTLELLAAHGPRNGFEPLLARAQTLFRGFVTTGRLELAVLVAERMQFLATDARFGPQFSARVIQSLGEMADAEAVSAMLDALYRRGPGAAVLARRLIDALGATVGRTFLVALAEETDKSKRHRLLEVLVSLGPAIVPEAMRLLGDERWYVVRNMVLILHRVGDPDSVQAVRDCALHPDLRVRLEAIKGLLKLDLPTARGLLARAINDPDPKLAETAIGLAGSYAIAEAVEPLLGIVDQWDVLGRRRSLRVRALRALGDLADPAALPRLERFFKNWLIPVVALEERRTAYRALQSYPLEARRGIVERGLRSRDDEIRSLCQRLQAQAAAAPPAARDKERAQRG
jgi:HEAT repeat protein